LLGTNIPGAVTQLKSFPTSGDIGISVQIANALHILNVDSEKSVDGKDGNVASFDSEDIEEY
jgi:hypothetical protein